MRSRLSAIQDRFAVQTRCDWRPSVGGGVDLAHRRQLAHAAKANALVTPGRGCGNAVLYGDRPQPVEPEAEVYALARAAGPLRRALARVAGRMVATPGWERLGFPRLADYARECAGMSPREVRDLARVDRALEALPRLDRAFVAGELGWTQLRLVCRVARPENEHEWLALACTGWAPHALRFALGLRPHHPPLLGYGPGEVRMA